MDWTSPKEKKAVLRSFYKRVKAKNPSYIPTSKGRRKKEPKLGYFDPFIYSVCRLLTTETSNYEKHSILVRNATEFCNGPLKTFIETAGDESTIIAVNVVGESTELILRNGDRYLVFDDHIRPTTINLDAYVDLCIDGMTNPTSGTEKLKIQLVAFAMHSIDDIKKILFR